MQDEIDNKANIDGYYEMLTAGAADNLTGRGDGVGAKFIYRTAGGTESIADGEARINNIKGNTLVWNQLIQSIAITRTANGVTATLDGTGKVLATGTADENGVSVIVANPNTIPIISSHKYLLRGAPSGSSNSTYYLITTNVTVWGGSQNRRDIGNGCILTAQESGNVGVNFGALNGQTVDVAFYPQLFDLTRMFGAGNEPATVEAFEALFPESYYPYDAGSLLNVNMEGVRTVGFNQWDEEWERGQFDGNGVPTANDNVIRSKNFIPVFGNTSYYFNTAGQTAYIRQYDDNKNFIGTRTAVSNSVFTTDAAARYVRFNLSSGYGKTYNNDICINLSWSGYRNGEYEEHWQQERHIPVSDYFPDGMKSAGAVYDELTAHKAIQRIGELVLTGNESGVSLYSYSDYTGFAFQNKIPDTSSYIRAPYVSADFGHGNGEQVPNNNQFAWLGVGNRSVYLLWANCPYSTVQELQNWLTSRYEAGNPVKFYYPIAEPVETEILPELNLTYKVSDFGTEEIMHTGETAPVPMQIAYGVNAVDTIRNLPVNYISHASFLQFISAIESHFNVTITETYDGDHECYTYSITANGE